MSGTPAPIGLVALMSAGAALGLGIVSAVDNNRQDERLTDIETEIAATTTTTIEDHSGEISGVNCAPTEAGGLNCTVETKP